MKRLAFYLLLSWHVQLLIAGTIVSNISTLPSFGNVYAFNSSTSLRYTVSGTSLTAPLIVTSSLAFEVSLTYNSGYSRSLTLTPVSGTLSNTVVYVRFSPATVGTYTSGNNIVNASVGSPSVNISVSGVCIANTVPTGVGTYYSTIGNARGASLKTALYNKISVGTTAVGYTPGVWNAFSTTDIQPNGKIWDIYSTRFDINSPYEYVLSTDQCGTYSVEGDCYNREHSFPQSWFNSSAPMVSELNHVFASDGKVNGVRSNYPYGNVSSATSTSLYGGKLGTGTNNFGYTGIVFEPIDEYKGDVARAYLFMATRYQNLIGGWSGNGNAGDVLAGNSFPAYLSWHISLLLSWHNLDPVSDKEIKRNNAVAALQGNRNPFIDSPQYAQRIWGGSIYAQPTIASSNFSFTHNGTNTLNLNWRSGNGTRRLVVAKAGSAINSLPVDTVGYLANATFGSGANLGNNCFVVYNGTGSSCTITGLNNTTNYYFAIIEYNGVSNVSNYNTSSFFSSGIVALPVKWLGFSANLQSEQSVLLHWQTAMEQNNERFEVERSNDLVNWQIIQQLKGAGNSHKVVSYQTVDNTIDANKMEAVYYRIKQIDVNGAFSYSQVRKVQFDSENAIRLVTSPNPFTDYVNISFLNTTEQAVELEITTAAGHVIKTWKEELNEQNKIITIADLQYLPQGVYFITVNGNSNRQIIKCIKQ